MYKKLAACLMALIMIMAMPASVVFASGGDGSGGGKNKNLPFKMDYCSVENGAQDISLNETIQMDFSKNVCNVLVLADNKKCFHLTDEDGNAVTIRLTFPDDQVQHDYKRQVFITPVEEMYPLSEYKLSVDNTLKAKNGKTLEEPVVIKFTTGTVTTEETNVILDTLGENIVSYESNLPVIEDEVEEDGEGTNILAMSIAGIVVILIITATVIFAVIRNKKKQQ